MNYDFYRQHGNSHTCVCGSEWTDSDCGPCHFICKKCERIIEVEEASEEDENICEQCAN
jgi:hypothetical protein